MPSDEPEEPISKKLVEVVAQEPLAIEELRKLIAHFESEITRAKAEIERKQSLLGSVEALFKD